MRSATVITAELSRATARLVDATKAVEQLKFELGQDEAVLTERLGAFWWRTLKGEGLQGYSYHEPTGCICEARVVTLRLLHDGKEHTIYLEEWSGGWSSHQVPEVEKAHRKWTGDDAPIFWKTVLRETPERLHRVVLGIWWQEFSGQRRV
jgi:hypothetical protein